jgi:hypothetical protein
MPDAKPLQVGRRWKKSSRLLQRRVKNRESLGDGASVSVKPYPGGRRREPSARQQLPILPIDKTRRQGKEISQGIMGALTILHLFGRDSS